ncbi:trypsin-like peptidase domain-containing protein [Pendulispora rubella]|uniref:Trypsin-like peptidase domain-containing protein n=1 Tax=Pendulispora rubella TaxID=2741070 RepID=A0ABZ2L0W1_9BACT
MRNWAILVAAPVVALSVLSMAACGKRSGGGGASAEALPSGAVPVPSGVVPVPKSPSLSTGGTDLAKSGPLSFAPIAKQADPSVVTIATIGEEVEALPGFTMRGRRREIKGLGTGFIIDKDGTVLTNNHVIEGAEVITVRLADNREYPGKLVGRDPRTDIAVVRLEAKDRSGAAQGGAPFQPLPLGDSDGAEVGDWTVAIGNPFGLSHTVSAGIISAKGRTRDDVPLDPTGYYNFLQTDASINPGNSGGPLLNLRGEVVGINTAIRGGGAQGIGFAIPINMVKQLLPMLLRDGHVTRSALGVRIRDIRELAPEDRTELKLTDDKGAVIEYVAPGSPADKADLKAGDVIVQFDGQPIDRGTLLSWMASTAGVGKTVTLRVLRMGKAFDLKVTLGELQEKDMPKPRRVSPLPTP